MTKKLLPLNANGVRPVVDTTGYSRPEPDLQSTISIGSRMAHVKDIESFYNFIGYVLLTAPDRFPAETIFRTTSR